MVKKIIGYVAVALVVGLLIGYAFFHSTPEKPALLGGTTHFSGVTVQEDGLVLEDGGDVTLGSGSELTLVEDSIIVNGIETSYVQDTSMATATTTVCALAAPGDSILLSATVDFTTSTTSATTVTLAKASTPYATTTSLGTGTLSANEAETLVATTTSHQVWHSGEYFVVGMQNTSGSGQTGTLGVYSPVGTCNAVFQSVD